MVAQMLILLFYCVNKYIILLNHHLLAGAKRADCLWPHDKFDIILNSNFNVYNLIGEFFQPFFSLQMSSSIVIIVKH